MTRRDYFRSALVTGIAVVGSLVVGLDDDTLTAAEALTAAGAGMSALAASLGIPSTSRRARRRRA